MARKNPDDTAQTISKHREGIRRKYRSNKNLDKDTKLVLGEREFRKDMVVTLKFAGYSNSQIAKIIGMSRGQVKSMLEEEDVSERIVALQKRIPAAAQELIQSYMVEAVMTVVDVMRTEKEWKARLESAGNLLDRGGVPKSSRSEANVHKVDERRTTFSDDGIVEALRQLPPEKQEEAAQMMEDFQEFLNVHAEAESNDEPA